MCVSIDDNFWITSCGIYLRGLSSKNTNSTRVIPILYQLTLHTNFFFSHLPNLNTYTQILFKVVAKLLKVMSPSSSTPSVCIDVTILRKRHNYRYQQYLYGICNVNYALSLTIGSLRRQALNSIYRASDVVHNYTQGSLARTTILCNNAQKLFTTGVVAIITTHVRNNGNVMHNYS